MLEPFTPAARRAADLGIACLAVLVAACSDSSGPELPPTGRYTLRTLDGRALPTICGCNVSVSGGTLAVTSDSVVLHLTTDQGRDAGAIEARGSYTRSPDGRRLVVSYAGVAFKDSVTAGAWGRVTDRAWLPVSAACTGGVGVQADLGFAGD
jgi:hypothetical protein